MIERGVLDLGERGRGEGICHALCCAMLGVGLMALNLTMSSFLFLFLFAVLKSASANGKQTSRVGVSIH